MQEQSQYKQFEKTENVELDQDVPYGSTICDAEEKAARKYDDWRGHRHEKQRDPNTEYRETELHGVVGKEIEQVIERDKPKVFKNQNLDYGNDIFKENTADMEKDKHKPKDFNNKVLDINPKENILANQEAEKLLEKIEHQGQGFRKTQLQQQQAEAQQSKLGSQQ